MLLPIVLLTACASATPTAIPSIQAIEGKWAGTITLGSGSQEFYYLTIHPDGSIVAQWGINWQWGRITLSGGQGSFELMERITGSIRYYAGPSSRSLRLDPEFGAWTAYVTPVT
jgi:hypothetical protein